MATTKYWMISNRNVKGSSLGSDRDRLRFWTCPDGGGVKKLSNWSEQSRDRFKTALVAAANRFPTKTQEQHEDQKHVTIFVHGYNSSWQDAAGRYQSIVDGLFTGPDGLGLCILFTWPSDGHVYDYLPDREDARKSADDFADVLSALYDWLLDQQAATAEDGKACRAKTSVIAHSMGNYVLQCAMQTVWTRKNRPLLVSLINQLLMVAADVDNDIFKTGENVGSGDGEGIANLTYRVTALYSGMDQVLGVAAGLKHFGKRRLGRSGLDRSYPVPDNVWDIDCSPFFRVDERNVHSAYFEYPGTLELMRQLLRGIDRRVLTRAGTAPAEGTVPVAPTAVGAGVV
jgi:esterase/lipase superfamily enzyme